MLEFLRSKQPSWGRVSLSLKALVSQPFRLVLNCWRLVLQGCTTISVSDTSMLRSEARRDSENFPVSQAPDAGLPFKAQQLKQLRAQCIVFLALRNGLKPKELHLEIALGNVFTKEEGPQKDDIGKEQIVSDPSSVEEVTRSLERLESSGSSLKEADDAKNSQQN